MIDCPAESEDEFFFATGKNEAFSDSAGQSFDCKLLVFAQGSARGQQPPRSGRGGLEGPQAPPAGGPMPKKVGGSPPIEFICSVLTGRKKKVHPLTPLDSHLTANC